MLNSRRLEETGNHKCRGRRTLSLLQKEVFDRMKTSFTYVLFLRVISVMNLAFNQINLVAASSLIGNNLDYDPGYQIFNITSGGNDYFILKLEPYVPSASTDTRQPNRNQGQRIHGPL